MKSKCDSKFPDNKTCPFSSGQGAPGGRVEEVGISKAAF